MNRKKRGSSPIDWVISVSIFILYLGWFFLFIRPSFDTQVTSYSVEEKVQEALKNDASQDMEELQVFLLSNYSLDHQLIEVSLKGLKDDAAIAYMPSSQDGDRLFFLSNLSPGINHEKMMINSPNQRKNFAFDLIANENFSSVDSPSFKVEFDKSIPKTVQYLGSTRISNIEMTVESEKVAPEIWHYENLGFVSKYLGTYSSLSLKSYVASSNSNLLLDLIKARNQSHRVSLNLFLDEYENYLFSPENGGQINYSDPECVDKDTDQVAFFDGSQGVYFLINESSQITFCYSNDSGIILNISSLLIQDRRISILFYQGDSSMLDQLRAPYSYSIGPAEKLQGLLESRIKELSSSDYAQVKDNWGIDKGYDFRIEILNSTISDYMSGKARIIYSIGPDKPSNKKVGAINKEMTLVDLDGEPGPVGVIINSWAAK